FLYLSFFDCPSHHRLLHSFPTRRSSDLVSSRRFGQSTCAIFTPRPLLPSVISSLSNTSCRLPSFTVDCARDVGFMVWRHSRATRSEEHTSELQSRENLVCRLLLEKKKK